MKGIFKITNRLNGKTFVGSAPDIEKKWNVMKKPGTWERYDKYPIYVEIKQLGIENFEMEPLEEVECDEALLVREQFWKEKLRPEYNSLSERKQWK